MCYTSCLFLGDLTASKQDGYHASNCLSAYLGHTTMQDWLRYIYFLMLRGKNKKYHSQHHFAASSRHSCHGQARQCEPCRDGAMRTELESRLVFAAPSELLVASPVSAASQRLLGAYSGQTAGLRSQTAPREKYSSAGAQAVLTSFYTHAGR